MAIWNRRVTVTSDGKYLQVDNDTTNPNPPGNSDPADSITTDSAERPATINYLANGPVLTGVKIKGRGKKPDWLDVSNGGLTLQIVDNGTSGTSVSYYLEGTWLGKKIKSRDPQIHNDP
jgi:hypothetical protein